MTSRARECPFDGCRRRIDPSLFACRAHWFSLNRAQQAAIWDCYGLYQSGDIDIEELQRRQQVVLDEVQGRMRP